jgi:hypothetical protein
MSQEPQTKEKGFFDDASFAMQIIYWFCSMWAASVEVMLRHSFGQRYLGLQAAAVLLWIPIYISLWGDPSALPLLTYLLFYIVVLLIHRSHGLVRWHRGEREHSCYSGRPHVMKLFRGIDELPVKTLVEPGIVLGVGSLLCGLAEGFGAYFLGAAFCLAVKGAIERAQEDKIVMDTRDAFFMQRRLRERMGKF